MINSIGNFISHYVRITFQCEFLVLLDLNECLYCASKIIFSGKVSFGVNLESLQEKTAPKTNLLLPL